MKQLKLNLKDDVYEMLQREFKNFVRLSTKVYSGFVAPSFDAFLMARLSDNTNFLTEEAVQHLMMSGQYAWARRAMDKDFPDVVAILISEAANYGFHIAVRHDWSTDDLTEAARAWATAIIKQSKGDETQVDVLAAQIKSAAVSITVVQEKLKTPATRLAHALGQQISETQVALEHARGVQAREWLGSFRTLLKLGVAYGSIKEQGEKDALAKLQAKRPQLFHQPSEGVFAKLAAWWQLL